MTCQPNPVAFANQPRVMLEQALAAEEQAITDYTDRRDQADALGDIGLKVALENLIADEMGHKEEIERILTGWDERLSWIGRTEMDKEPVMVNQSSVRKLSLGPGKSQRARPLGGFRRLMYANGGIDRRGARLSRGTPQACSDRNACLRAFLLQGHQGPFVDARSNRRGANRLVAANTAGWRQVKG